MCIGSRNPDVKRLVRRAYLLDIAAAENDGRRTMRGQL